MIMRGSCSCNNISVTWKNTDYSLVPRECLCDYCSAMRAAYVSKSGTSIEVEISKEHLHTIREHGSRQASFHECLNCGEAVFVTVSIKGVLYGALNVHCLDTRQCFPEAISVNFSEQPPEVKLERWRENWCHPVLITSQASRDGLPAIPV